MAGCSGRGWLACGGDRTFVRCTHVREHGQKYAPKVSDWWEAGGASGSRSPRRVGWPAGSCWDRAQSHAGRPHRPNAPSGFPGFELASAERLGLLPVDTRADILRCPPKVQTPSRRPEGEQEIVGSGRPPACRGEPSLSLFPVCAHVVPTPSAWLRAGGPGRGAAGHWRGWLVEGPLLAEGCVLGSGYLGRGLLPRTGGRRAPPGAKGPRFVPAPTRLLQASARPPAGSGFFPSVGWPGATQPTPMQAGVQARNGGPLSSSRGL